MMEFMRKLDGLTADELLAKGFAIQPDGRMSKLKSWKSQCKICLKWFGRLKGDNCWLCYDHLRNEHAWAHVRADKVRSEDKKKRRSAERRLRRTKNNSELRSKV